jgi:hypothetical protein
MNLTTEDMLKITAVAGVVTVIALGYAGYKIYDLKSEAKALGDKR